MSLYGHPPKRKYSRKLSKTFEPRGSILRGKHKGNAVLRRRDVLRLNWKRSSPGRNAGRVDGRLLNRPLILKGAHRTI